MKIGQLSNLTQIKNRIAAFLLAAKVATEETPKEDVSLPKTE